MIYLIGMGPGNIKYLTYDALEKIKSSSRVISFGRIGKSVKEIRSDVIAIQNVDEIIAHINEKDNIAILASGDPCFYGILEYLGKNNIKIDQVIPGISSFQYMMAKLKKSYHDAYFVSLHGRDTSLEEVKKHRLSIIITDKKNTPDTISKALYKQGVRGKIYAGFNLSYDDEIIVEKNIGEDIEDYSFLCLVVVENEMD